MFERLFKAPHALARQRNGPLAEERLRYLTHCAGQQMAAITLRHIASYILLVAKALRLAERPGEVITRAEIEAEAGRWVGRRPSSPIPRADHRSRVKFTSQAVRWLTYLGRLQPAAVVPQPYADQVARYADYMLRERGLAPRTIEHNRLTVQEFLRQIDEAGVRLEALTVAQVDEVVVRKVRDNGHSRVTIRRWASALRPFLRFAERLGWCRPGLADGIRTPRLFPHENLPLGPSWHDVNRLLAAAQGDSPLDVRDRALLLLLAVYGLRAGEVTALRLEDFDWQRRLLTVAHGKRQRPRTYPLCQSVGDAVSRYLREVRTQSEYREVFLTLLAPFRPLRGASLGGMVSRRLHALGLTLPRYGAHALRHACATHLLARGLSLKEIGDHLGHQSPEATRIYAKVDLASLRIVGDFSLEGLL